MKNVVGNFVTCTDGLYRPFKIVQHENETDIKLTSFVLLREKLR